VLTDNVTGPSDEKQSRRGAPQRRLRLVELQIGLVIFTRINYNPMMEMEIVSKGEFAAIMGVKPHTVSM
jgi:hypothetical protein